jgi:hypothetical protein
MTIDRQISGLELLLQRRRSVDQQIARLESLLKRGHDSRGKHTPYSPRGRHRVCRAGGGSPQSRGDCLWAADTGCRVAVFVGHPPIMTPYWRPPCSCVRAQMPNGSSERINLICGARRVICLRPSAFPTARRPDLWGQEAYRPSVAGPQCIRNPVPCSRAPECRLLETD